jgi:hypothetical protein
MKARMRLSLAKTTRAPRRNVGVAFGVALGFAALPARAHAPPLGAQVLSAPSPEVGSEEVVVTNRGLVFRDRDTGSSRLLCNEALRIDTAELPNVALLGDGGLLVATSRGLRLSQDRGCSWSDVGQMETTNTPALAADPHDPNRVLVANYDNDTPGLRETRDAGTSWRLLLETDPDDYVHSLAIGGGDPRRIYATVATYGLEGPPVHSLLRTGDGGETWQRRALPLNEKDYLAAVAAISPDDADTVILYTVANSPGLDSSRLLVSHDGGDSFEVAFERPEIRGAGYAEGAKLWVAARDGLYASNAELSAFSQISIASELGCVGERAGELFVCGHYAGVASAQSGIGISSDGGQSFEPWLDFAHVDAAVACSPESLTTSLCARPWLDWQTEMLGGVPASPGAYGPVGSSPTTGGPVAAPSASPPDGNAAPVTPADATPDALDDATSAGCALAERGPSTSDQTLASIAILAAGLGLCRRARRVG